MWDTFVLRNEHFVRPPEHGEDGGDLAQRLLVARELVRLVQPSKTLVHGVRHPQRV